MHQVWHQDLTIAREGAAGFGDEFERYRAAVPRYWP
jgi:hypothetical protein